MKSSSAKTTSLTPNQKLAFSWTTSFKKKKKWKPAFGRTISPLKSSSPLTTWPSFANKISNDPFLQIFGQSDPFLQISLTLASLCDDVVFPAVRGQDRRPHVRERLDVVAGRSPLDLNQRPGDVSRVWGDYDKGFHGRSWRLHMESDQWCRGYMKWCGSCEKKYDGVAPVETHSEEGWKQSPTSMQGGAVVVIDAQSILELASFGLTHVQRFHMIEEHASTCGGWCLQWQVMNSYAMEFVIWRIKLPYVPKKEVTKKKKF